jgi:uroporphyrinogen-III synthase
MPKDLPDLNLKYFDEILFTSPSGVRNFIKRYRRLPHKVKIRWIGKVTKAEIIRQGLMANN